MSKASADTPKGLSPLAAGAVLAGALGLSTALALLHSPDPAHPRTRRWYKMLRKPPFTPPDPVFGAVWPAIQSGLAYGGYRLLRQAPSPARTVSVTLLLGSLTMIGGWSELFFGRKALGTSTVAAGAMLAGGVAYGVSAAKVDRVAAATAVPYVAWLSFATVLAGEIWRLNGSRPSGREGGAVRAAVAASPAA